MRSWGNYDQANRAQQRQGQQSLIKHRVTKKQTKTSAQGWPEHKGKSYTPTKLQRYSPSPNLTTRKQQNRNHHYQNTQNRRAPETAYTPLRSNNLYNRENSGNLGHPKPKGMNREFSPKIGNYRKPRFKRNTVDGTGLYRGNNAKENLFGRPIGNGSVDAHRQAGGRYGGSGATRGAQLNTPELINLVRGRTISPVGAGRGQSPTFQKGHQNHQRNNNSNLQRENYVARYNAGAEVRSNQHGNFQGRAPRGRHQYYNARRMGYYQEGGAGNGGNFDPMNHSAESYYTESSNYSGSRCSSEYTGDVDEDGLSEEYTSEGEEEYSDEDDYSSEYYEDEEQDSYDKALSVFSRRVSGQAQRINAAHHKGPASGAKYYRDRFRQQQLERAAQDPKTTFSNDKAPLYSQVGLQAVDGRQRMNRGYSNHPNQGNNLRLARQTDNRESELQQRQNSFINLEMRNNGNNGAQRRQPGTTGNTPIGRNNLGFESRITRTDNKYPTRRGLIEREVNHPPQLGQMGSQGGQNGRFQTSKVTPKHSKNYSYNDRFNLTPASKGSPHPGGAYGDAMDSARNAPQPGVSQFEIDTSRGEKQENYSQKRVVGAQQQPRNTLGHRISAKDGRNIDLVIRGDRDQYKASQSKNANKGGSRYEGDGELSHGERGSQPTHQNRLNYRMESSIDQNSNLQSIGKKTPNMSPGRRTPFTATPTNGGPRDFDKKQHRITKSTIIANKNSLLLPETKKAIKKTYTPQHHTPEQSTKNPPPSKISFKDQPRQPISHTNNQPQKGFPMQQRATSPATHNCNGMNHNNYQSNPNSSTQNMPLKKKMSKSNIHQNRHSLKNNRKQGLPRQQNNHQNHFHPNFASLGEFVHNGAATSREGSRYSDEDSAIESSSSYITESSVEHSTPRRQFVIAGPGVPASPHAKPFTLDLPHLQNHQFMHGTAQKRQDDSYRNGSLYDDLPTKRDHRDLQQNGNSNNPNYTDEGSSLEDGEESEPEFTAHCFFRRLHQRNYIRAFEDGFADYLSTCRQELLKAKKLLKASKVSSKAGEPVYLPRTYTRKKVILLDMDETLIHSEEYKQGTVYDLIIDMTGLMKNTEKIGVFIRPYCRQFLERLKDHFELVIFTAARKDYADKVISKLDPYNNIFTARLYRRNCTQIMGSYVKDFRVIKNRAVEDMMLVDNLIYSYSLNLQNGLPIKPYLRGSDDCELEFLAERLTALKPFHDLREFLEKEFRLSEFYNFL